MNRRRLRDRRHPLPVEVHFADAFDPCQHVVDRLAADTYQLRPHDASDEITGQFENFLGRPAVESLAENGGHGASERLDLRSQRHTEMGFAFFIHLEINAHSIGALFILADIVEDEFFPWPRLLLLRVVRVGDERFASFDFGQRLKQADDRF